MSGGIISWVEDGPDEDEQEEERRWYRRYADAGRVRTALLGKGLRDEGKKVYASDPRYRMFADYVLPLQWQVAAQQRKLTLPQVATRLVRSGPDGLVLKHYGLTVEEWEAKIVLCLDAAEKDDRVVAIDFDTRWHATGGHVNDVPDEEFDVTPLEPHTGYPEERQPTPKADTQSFLQRAGIKRDTEGRPDRPSKSAEAQKRQRRARKERQALGRKRTEEDPS